MGKWWSLLFAVVMTACLLLFVVAPFVSGWWLPEGVSEHAGGIDTLFYIILAATGFFFILTEALLIWFMFKYSGDNANNAAGGTSSTPSVPFFLRPFASFLNSQHRVEMAWTIVPGLILFYIAVAQIGTWADVKYRSRVPQLTKDKPPVQIAVSARQFEWRMRYPSPSRYKKWRNNYNDKDVVADFNSFKDHPQADDIHGVNELHVIKGRPVLVQLTTRDVLHSFNIPYMRVKQDALPGKLIPVWFTPNKHNTKKKGDEWLDGYDAEKKTFGHENCIWEVACAELCGWGHYRMLAHVYVHENDASFLEWLEHADNENNATQRK